MGNTGKYLSIAAFVLSLPALLFIYQPSMQLGGIGLLLGAIGMYLTPIAIFGGLGYWVYREWNK